VHKVSFLTQTVSDKAMNIEIIYFPFPFWRAEVSRLALHLSGIPFTNTHINKKTFLQMREEGLLPFGQVPIMIVNGTTIAQTGAIARYCGKLSGLYPTDPIEAALVDQFIDGASDLTKAMWPSIWIKDPERRYKKRKEAVDVIIPKWFGFFETLIDSPYCIKSFSIADLALWRLLGWFSEGQLDQVPTDILKGYPKLTMLYTTVGSKPEIKDWMKTYAKN
jgi:prostaglandin-H2 D-isomerase / glutathione transferase